MRVAARTAARLLLQAMVVAVALPAGAQPVRGLVPDDYHRLQAISEPSLSPDGTLVAYVVTRVDRAQNRRVSDIWVAPADGHEPPAQLTAAQSSRSPLWSPDGLRIAFISARAAPNAPATAAPPRPQVHALTVGRGGDAQRLTDLKDGVDAFSWSPDGKRLAVLSNVAAAAPAPPPESSDLKRYTHSFYKSDGVGYADGTRAHIFVVDLANGATTQVTSGDERDDEAPSWSPDGTRLAFAAQRTDAEGEGSLDIWTVPAAGGPLTRVSDVVFRISSPRWSPDGNRIAYIGSEDQHTPKIRVAPATGGPSTVVAPEFTFPADLVWSAGGRSIYAGADVKGERHLFRVDLATHAVTAVTSGARMISRHAISASAQRAAYVVSDATCPGDLYVADLAAGHERRLTRLNDETLRLTQLADVDRITFKGADGWDIDGFFMKPVGWQQGKRYPMILAIHGGPNGMYGVGWSPDFQAMAARGYAVFFTNPRGSSGYGAPFQRAVANQWGGKAYQDIMNGVDAILTTHPWIDPSRLAVTGQSYGGFMTNWIVGHTTRFSAAVSLSGISDFISVNGTRDGFYGHAADFGGDLFERFTEFWNTSPLKYASQVKTPTLILHGDADHRVPLSQGEEFFRALRHFGVPSELVIFPREPHSLRREPRHQVQVIELTLDWFDRYLTHRGS